MNTILPIMLLTTEKRNKASKIIKNIINLKELKPDVIK